jgi:K+-transporting ATPase A subunit
MKKINLLILFLLSIAQLCHAQSNTVEMADVMRAEGKIYVVVGIILIILIGLILYLFTLDRKVKNLENLFGERERQTK